MIVGTANHHPEKLCVSHHPLQKDVLEGGWELSRYEIVLYIQIWFIIQLKQPFINGWPWGSMMLYAAYSKCVCRPKIPSANLRFERTSQSPIFHVKKQVVCTGRDGRKVHLTVHMFFLFFHFLFVFFLIAFWNPPLLKHGFSILSSHPNPRNVHLRPLSCAMGESFQC